MQLKINVICTVGLPGAGKGLFVKAAERLGIKYYIMGDVIREGAIKVYGEANPKTTGKYMREIRERMGRDAVAKLIYEKIGSSKEVNEGDIILIDGVRCVEEVEYFKKHFLSVILIAVLADLETRYKRIIARKRVDDIKSVYDFLNRELRERRIGVEDAIKIADYYFINNYSSREVALQNAIQLLTEIVGELSNERKE